MNQNSEILNVDQLLPIYTENGMLINYTYTPCFGTHGSYGLLLGRCPKCGNPVYNTKENESKLRDNKKAKS